MSKSQTRRFIQSSINAYAQEEQILFISGYRAKLHAIDEAVLRKNIGSNDEFVASDDALLTFQMSNGVFNRGVGFAGERHEKGLDGSE